MSAAGNGFGGGGFGGGIPGAPGAPAAAPNMMAGMVIEIDADPTWEPFDVPDVLDQDGYYACRIVRESGRSDANKAPGIFLTLEVQDADAIGKRISKFLGDPKTTKSDTRFVWRNILRSITGTLDAARAGFRYVPGAFANQIVYVRTGAYADGDSVRTGVETFVTKEEYDVAVAGAKHRWAPKPKGDRSALPTGLPGAFPATAAFPGMGGMPAAPSAAPLVAPSSVPAPPSAAPMQQAFTPPPPVALAQPAGMPGFPGFGQPAAAPQATTPQPAAGGLPPGTFPGQR